MFSSFSFQTPARPNVDESSTAMENPSNPSPEIVTEPKSSLMVTAKPFTRQRSFKKQRRQNPTLIHFDSLFSGNHWSKYLVLKTERSITPLKLEYNILKRCPTREISFRPIKENEWLIETTTKVQSENLLTVTNIEDVKVEVYKHATMNSIKGTVMLPKYDGDEKDIDKKIVLECLQMRYDNVEDLELYNIPSKRQERSPIKIARIKFKGQELPSKIIIFGQNREVRPFVPTPMQCKNCSKYGHTAKRCLNESICAYCGSSDHETRWNCGSPKCNNCGKDHHARSKECSFYMYNTELKILQDRTGMGIREAKLELLSKGFKDPSKDLSYRTAAQQLAKSKANENLDVETPTNNDNKEVRSNHTIETTTKYRQNQNRPLESDMIDPNPFKVLSDMEEEENEIWENAKEELEANENENPDSVDKKRPLERTPPKPKKQIMEEGSKGSSVRPKTQLAHRKYKEMNKKSIVKTGEEQIIGKISKDSELPLSKEQMEIEQGNKPTEDISNSPISEYGSDLSQLEIDPQKVEAEVHAKQSCSQTSKDDQTNNIDQEEISPSPIIGATGKLMQMTLSESKRDHNLSCGCSNCFRSEFKDLKNLTLEKTSNIIDNFVKYKTKNQNGKLDSHEPGCLCVDHLIKKRATGSLSLGKIIETFKQEGKTRTNQNESKIKQEENLVPKSKSNQTRISRNNNPQNKSGTSS